MLFALIAISIWASGHAYLAWSLGRFIPKKHIRWAVWGVLGLHFAVTLTTMTVRRFPGDSALKDALQWVGFVGMGMFALLFAACFARDMVLGAMKLAAYVRGRGQTPAPADREPAGADATLDAAPGHPLTDTPAADGPADPGRRELFNNVLNVGLLGVSAAGSTYGYFQATRIPEVRRVDVPIQGLADGLDGFKIAQLSDIHIGPTIKRPFVEGVVKRTNGLNADLITVTGDLVDGYVKPLRHHAAPLGELSSRYGTYYVTGNHEYYWDAPGWVDEMARLGWHPLINAHEVLTVNGAKLLVGGVTDYRAGRRVEGHTTDPHKAIAGAPPVDFRLLLAHQPKSVWEAAKAGFDLQLSGHTHGGQFWPWSLLVGMAHPFSRGLNDYEKMKIYVSCGTGYWGPPLRLGAPSEITLLTLKKV